MSAQLRSMKTCATEAGTPVGVVEIFVGDANAADQSEQWISARVILDDTNVKSLALLQIAAVRKARDLLTDESDRLARLYQASERSQR